MKRIISTILLVCAGMGFSFAQGSDNLTTLQVGNSEAITSEKAPVTTSWSFLVGEADYANHYLDLLEHTGDVTGLEYLRIRNSAKYENISYRFSIVHLRNMHRTIIGGGLENFAQTSVLSTQNYEMDYAVFYNWSFFDRLKVRAGGSINAYGGFMFAEGNAINNVLSVDMQLQAYAAAQAKYGWDYEKFGLDVYAGMSFPVLGMMAVDSRYESSMESIGGSSFTSKDVNHIKLTSMHNLQGVNFEMGAGFAFKRHTLHFAIQSRCRWWNAYGLQNYRNNTLVKLGISFNMFTYQNANTNNRQF